MSWNYRVVERDDSPNGQGWFEIHEVYYRKDGTVRAWTEEPIAASGESPEEVATVLRRMLKDVEIWLPLKASRLPK